MEAFLYMQKPLSCSRSVIVFSGSKSRLKIKPFQGFLNHGSTITSLQSSSPTKDGMTKVVSSGTVASAEFSRRRARKNTTSRIKNSDPKGFMPKPSIGLGTQKSDQKRNEEKETAQTVLSKEMGQDETSKHIVKNIELSEGAGGVLENEIKSRSSRLPSKDKQLGTSLESFETAQGYFEGQRDVANDFVEGEEMGFIRSKEMKHENDESQETNTIVDGAVEVPVVKSRVDREKVQFSKSDDLSKGHSSDRSNNSFQSPDSVEERIVSKKEQDERICVKMKLEMEENLLRQALERLAKHNLLEGNKVFNYPEGIKPDENIAIFLNRSLSTLKDEPDILIMGAFNDWRWRSFTLKLNKSNLDGDWWYCQIHVPREAYNLDFVFFNAKEVYDNNDRKDFRINVEGGISVFEFEDFLLEEKRKELERVAKEQAEMERQAEENRRIEAERAASEADRAEAQEEVAKRRVMLQELTKKAKKSGDSIWCIEPCEFSSTDKVRLYYNKSTGPLIHSTNIWVHGGHNNWQDGLSIVERLVKSDKEGGDWWYSDVIVPDRALVLDWVFADGPPQDAMVYDNNNFQDFHAIVSQRISEDLYWVEEEHILYKRLQEERRLIEEAIRAKVAKTEQMKAAMKEKTLKTFLLSQKHIVYTEPLNVEAGKPVTVYYNPGSTVLNGKSEIWFRGSFNRWTHRFGPLPPQKMVPAENGFHVKTTVKVPLDAYMMDFVFSDGQIFDNKNSMDYHIPVFGGVTKEPPMHIVHVAVEMAPIAKVGGLGEVVTSLSRAVQDMKHSVDVILPKYDCMNLSSVKNLHYQTSVSLAATEVKVWFGKVEGVSVYFLEPQNGYFWTGRIYGCQNDGERFNFFCHAALEFLQQNGFHPDIIHCHDWSSAPVTWLFKEHYKNYGISKARVVFTIHNLEFGAQNIGRAMLNSDKATTVSPTYSKEVSGNPVVAPYLYKFHGILNGIDSDIWDPFNDKFIPISYTSENVVEGKRAAKDALQQRLGLERADFPLVGIITRLTHQKGIHLIKHAIGRTLERNGQVVLLGSAPDPRIQADFVNMANHLHSTHNNHARLCLSYDEPLSHLIYAGADFILVPSIFEPCGLTQLTAMRYGSIPVVRKTGGLYDTVFDVDDDKERAHSQGLEPNGFNFDGADTAGVDYALNRAISAWFDGREWFNSLCKRVMEQDWSWNRPALDYLELYHATRK